MRCKQIRTPDSWFFDLVGDTFRVKDMLCVKGQVFTDSNPLNMFLITGVALKTSRGPTYLSDVLFLLRSSRLSCVLLHACMHVLIAGSRLE
jgi:hypothetical protein